MRTANRVKPKTDFSFRLEEAEFEDLMADVREKVGFTQELVCAELKGRLFDEV